MHQRGNILLLILVLFLQPVKAEQLQPDFLPDTINVNIPDHIINLTAFLIDDGELEKAKELIDYGLHASSDYYLLTNLNYYYADYLYYQQNYDSAQSVYLSVLPRFEALKDTVMIAKTLNSIGLIYSFKEDHEKELQFYIKEYELLQKVKNKTHQLQVEHIVLLTNIINVYSSESDYEKVLELAQKAIEIAESINDSIRLGSILNAVGTAYKGLNKIDKSLEVYHRASSIFKATKDDFRNSFIQNNIGVLYENVKKDLDQALYYYRESLNGFEKEGYKWGITQAQLGIASVLAKKGEYAESEETYREVIDTSNAYGFSNNTMLALQALAKLKYDTGEYREAYDLFNRHHILNDSLLNAQKMMQYAELEAQYNVIQKENEINSLKTEKLRQELQLNQAQRHKQLLISTVFLFLLIIYVIFRYYVQKRKDNKMLEEKNAQIQQQYEELEKKNDYIRSINKRLNKSGHELKQANIAKNKFFSILAHDLRNPFHNIIGDSYLLSNNFNDLNSEEKIKFASDIKTSCIQVNRLLDNLMEWSRTQSNGLQFQSQKVQLGEVLENAISVLKQNAQAKEIKIESDIDKDIELEADKQMLETILRNIINNGIKFTEPGGTIRIQAKTTKKWLRIDIADTGVGMSNDAIKKLFRIDSNFKTTGTNNERGTGLGLVICKEFMKMHQGKIEVKSEVEKGSVFKLKLPVNRTIT